MKSAIEIGREFATVETATSLVPFLFQFDLWARQTGPGIFLRLVSRAIESRCGGARVQIRMHGAGPRGVVAEIIDGIRSNGPLLAFARPLVAGSVRYGQILVQFSGDVPNRRSLLVELETVSLLLALYAERLDKEQYRSLLRRRVAKLSEELATDKAVSRAGGLVARWRGVSLPEARDWLQAEAVRRAIPLRRVAEEWIAGAPSEEAA